MALPTLTPSSQISKSILPATGTITAVAATLPYGIYSTSTDFLSGAVDQVAYTYKKLGGDVLDIELLPGNVYANYLKANIKDLDKDTSLRGRKIKKGQLRRSSGTWQPKKDSNTILAGPRTKNIGRRGKTTKYADGFYAHIVEKGDFAERFGGKHRTQNTGIFEQGKKATKSRSEKLQFILLKREFANYAKTL